MPILRNLLSREQRSQRHMPRLEGSGTASSVVVTPERSLQVAAVYSCVRLLSESVAALPTGLYQRTTGYRKRLDSHPLARLLLEYPNRDIDAGEYFRTVMGWMLLRGNGYVYIERNNGGRPVALWPVSPRSVTVTRSTQTGQLGYKLTPDTSSEYVPVKAGYDTLPGEMLHYRAFGLGTEGLSPIGMARQQIGTSFASTSYIGGFFARDASPGGRIEVPGELTDSQFDRLVTQWKGLHGGFDRSHELAVMEGGAKWETTTLSPADAQFIEVYKLTRTDIAAMFGVPAHKVGDLDRATFSNIEQQSQEYVQDSLLSWLVRLEKVTRRLFDDDGTYLRFNVAGLLRGDTAARYAAYAQGRQWGFLSSNDIRRSEDLDPIDGGDDYLVPLNMVPAANTPTQRSRRSREVRAEARAPVDQHPAWLTRIGDVLAGYFADLGDEIGGRGDLAAAARDDWDAALEGRLTGPIGDCVAQFAQEAAVELGGMFNPLLVVNWVQAAAQREAGNINLTTFEQLADALDVDVDDQHSEGAVVGEVLGRRSSVDSTLIAAGLVTSAGNFGAHEGARQSGASTKTWVTTSANPRPSHAAMNGETVPMEDNFSNGMRWPGDSGGGADEVAGCRCAVRFQSEEQ